MIKVKSFAQIDRRRMTIILENNQYVEIAVKENKERETNRGSYYTYIVNFKLEGKLHLQDIHCRNEMVLIEVIQNNLSESKRFILSDAQINLFTDIMDICARLRDNLLMDLLNKK